MFFVIFTCFFILFVLWCFVIHRRDAPPIAVFHSSTPVTDAILKNVPTLKRPFRPPLWGRNGHLQTLAFLATRYSKTRVEGERRWLKASDGATVTFDLFERTGEQRRRRDATVCLAPGMGNSAVSGYVRSCVKILQEGGFRVAVLNHLGAIPEVPLTSPRIYSYGATNEFDLMVRWVREAFPDSLFISVGFSMGANIVVKHLGETKTLKPFVGALSVCQGYDGSEGYKYMGFEHKPYMMALSRAMRTFFRLHKRHLFQSKEARRICEEKNIDLGRILAASDMRQIDEEYFRRIAGFESLESFYASESCSNYMSNISVPVVFLNSLDDPIVPPPLHQIALRFVRNPSSSAIHVTTPYGGHLGFFEGGILRCHKNTWLEKFILEFCDSLIELS